MLTLALQCHYTAFIGKKGKPMKTSSRYILVIFLAALSAVAADTVTGKWQIHQSIAGNDSDMTCSFTQNGEELAGTCDGAAGVVKIAGKVTEKKVSWTFQSEYNGSPLTLKYSGTLSSAEKMAGTVNVEPYGVDGDFTATPAK